MKFKDMITALFRVWVVAALIALLYNTKEIIELLEKLQ